MLQSLRDNEAQDRVAKRGYAFHFTQAMNFWNAGKVIYDLATLSRE